MTRPAALAWLMPVLMVGCVAAPRENPEEPDIWWER